MRHYLFRFAFCSVLGMCIFCHCPSGNCSIENEIAESISDGEQKLSDGATSEAESIFDKTFKQCRANGLIAAELTAHDWLVRTFVKENRLKEAEESYKQEIEFVKKKARHFLPIVLCKFATTVLAREGKYTEAEELYKKAMKLTNGDCCDYVDKSIPLMGLAALRYTTARFDEAHNYWSEAMSYVRSSNAGYDVRIAANSGAAESENAIGEFKKAEDYYKDSLDLHKRAVKRERRAYLSALTHYARFLVEQHRYFEAEKLFREAWTIHKSSGGKNAAERECRTEYAQLLETMGRNEESRRIKGE